MNNLKWRCDARKCETDEPSDDANTTEQLKPIHLYIVSCVRLVRDCVTLGVRRRPDILMVGGCSHAEMEADQVIACRPSVVLVDVGGREGMQAAHWAQSLLATAKLIAFAISSAEVDLVAGACAGFSGYVSQDAHFEDLLQAVRDVHAGRPSCTPDIAAALFDCACSMLQQSASPAAAFSLTTREQQVLELSNQGFSNKEIARTLGISPSTVKNHMHSILQKLGVERRTQTVTRLRA